MVESKTGILIDAYFKDGLWLSIKEDSGKKDYQIDTLPYFYISTSSELDNKEIVSLKNLLKGINEIIRTNKKNSEFVYKIIFRDIDALISSREHLSKDSILSVAFELREYDIPFVYRFFVDNKLSNFKKIKFNYEKNKILSFEVLEDVSPLKLDYLTFDLEVLPPASMIFPQPKDAPIISIAVLDNNQKQTVFLLANEVSFGDLESKLKKDFPKTDIRIFSDEVKLIEYFALFVGQKDPDLIFTYNGDGFDFEYLVKRYKYLTASDLFLGSRRIVFHKRGKKEVSVDGIVHLDVYVLIRLLNYLQVFNYSKFDLNSIYTKITGKPKLEMPPKQMRESYLNKDYSSIIKYNIDDVVATQELGIGYYGIVNEVSKLVHSPFFDILRTSAGQMVEKWFIDYFINHNLLIPNRPAQEEISERYRYTFEGAFVKDPIPGLHKNIVIVDFRSYHISLIMAYNISPETINVDNSGEEILGYKLSKKIKGFVPEILSDLLNIRIPIKEKIKTLDKNTTEYKTLYAKQYALKILLASTYGYMGFAGARWYCRSCLNIMYHLVRTKIQETISEFEKRGYQVIYGDTDSCFLHYDDLDKLNKDLEEINKTFPKSMSLELEDFFKSGVFVLSRDKEKAAKKKYALLKDNGELKIKGFEYVRRDWCGLVKDTQKKVLETVLEKEEPKEAIAYIKTVVKELQDRKVPNNKLVIQSFVHKSIANYKTINPAMAAMIDAKKKGKIIKTGEVIEYIITNQQNKTISEKARLAELTDEKDYDIDYYLNNQLIPAIYPILEVFNISKDELLTGKKQTGLGQFFK